MSGSLEGVNVIELSVAGVGPFTGKYLADCGATVVRIESLTHPDVVRLSPPYKDGVPRINASAFWTQNNSSKYAIGLNLKSAKGKDVARRLVKWCDILIENFAPGVVERLGMGYEELAQVKPDLIMASMSNLGRTGPCARHPGLGTNLQALSGLVHILGWPDRGPDNPFGAMPDRLAPPFAVATLLGALDYRERTGKGQYIELSQFEVACTMVAPLLLDAAVNQHDATRTGNRNPQAAPHGVYPCLGEDRWCAIAVLTDEEFACFCRTAGHSELIDDTRFAALPSRKANEDELDAIVSAWTSTRTAEEVMCALQAVGVSAGVVNTPADLFNDAQLAHRHHLSLVHHPEIGPHHLPGQPSLLSQTPAEIRPAPTFGQHNEVVMRDFLMMGEDEYAELIMQHVLEYP